MEDFFDYLNVMEEVEDEIQNPRIPKRYIRNLPDPRHFYSEAGFRRKFRFHADVVTNVILPLISEQLQRNDNRGLPVSPLIQLLVALRFYASGSFQEVQGDLRSVSQASVSIIINRVSVLLAEQLANFITFPQLEQAQRQNIAIFRTIADFPSVSGCIDCTHIPIQSPGGANAETFRNRKKYFSLNVQAVAGPRMEIMDIVVRYPGSFHDSVIFDRSSARVLFEQGRMRGLLLGDNGYACRPYLLTPLLNATNNREAQYNRSHRSTRNLVERMFGAWKKRFPCLSLGLRTKLDTTQAIICATAVLYNIGVQQHDVFEAEPPRYNEVVIENANNNLVGLAFRRQFINAHF